MKTTVKVTGYQQIKLNVIELEKRIERGAMRESITKAARLTTAAAKRNAPVGRTGLLKKSIKQKVSTSKKKGVVTVVIGASRKTQGQYDFGNGDIQTVRPSRYAHLVEMGTPQSPPKPFLRPAIESTRQAVRSKFKAEMIPAIQKAAARIKKSQLKSLSNGR